MSHLEIRSYNSLYEVNKSIFLTNKLLSVNNKYFLL